MRHWRPIALTVLCTFIVATFLGRWLLGVHFERPTLPSEAPDALYQEYDAMLEQYAHPDGVDYVGLRRDLLSERVYGYFAHQGPTTTPAAFPTDTARLAYQVNAYNALLRVLIARQWPLDSPLDIQGAIEPVAGFGLFQAHRFQIDGKRLSLSGLEKQMRQNPAYDPRVRLLLACGGQSCPFVQAPAFRGEHWEDEVHRAIRQLLEREANLQVDTATKTIRLNPMLFIYREELTQWLAAQNPPQRFETWLDQLSPASEAIGKRLAEGYTLESAPIRWDVDRIP